jgi:hypothetical protein
MIANFIAANAVLSMGHHFRLIDIWHHCQLRLHRRLIAAHAVLSLRYHCQLITVALVPSVTKMKLVIKVSLLEL